MNIKELEDKIKKEKNEDLILEIEYENKKYVRTMAYNNDKSEINYYEIVNDKIVEIEDEKILQYLKAMYDIQEKNIIY